MKYISMLLFFAAVVTGMVACHSTAAPEYKKTAPAGRTLTLGKTVEQSLPGNIRLPGVLEPFQKVSIFPRVNGFIKSISVDRGSHVRKGQVLLVLEAPEIAQQYYAAQSRYLQAKAGYAASKDNYERTLAVSAEPGTISAHDLELARARMLGDSALMNSELANFRAREVMLGYLTVTAPFDGVITERNVHPGALVGPDTKADSKPMLMLEQEDKLRLVLQVPEMYSGQLLRSAAVTFGVNALPGKEFQGTISRQAGTLNDKYRSEAVEIDVQNNNQQLKAGMYAEISLPLNGTASALVVPSSAVVTSTEKKYVIAVRDHKTKWIDVQEGNHHNDSTEIFGALRPGDNVVLDATDEIKDGITAPR
ncbi:MAG TPA: efflux RND transporter periplasmic adaptor subunit [Chitinophaga sp.]|uniref:efflux RND transporter periplasmic adaptor subunit n=1 Tax=Chitinophaga sp. TaxID=1869181 RepID=UPI002C83396D|nr:efflux RND transporter periplasmic adaptor subunit [Chitinophaga sp.]HVI48546.1 efflux RND transporter periplasmic adaptor subunit [Chitinophaga sp.]